MLRNPLLWLLTLGPVIATLIVPQVLHEAPTWVLWCFAAYAPLSGIGVGVFAISQRLDQESQRVAEIIAGAEQIDVTEILPAVGALSAELSANVYALYQEDVGRNPGAAMDSWLSQQIIAHGNPTQETADYWASDQSAFFASQRAKPLKPSPNPRDSIGRHRLLDS